jgi:hypothetical protein
MTFRKAELHIDLNERFDIEDNEDDISKHPFIKLADKENYYFINIEGEIRDDDWFYYKNVKVICMNEIKNMARISFYDPGDRDDNDINSNNNIIDDIYENIIDDNYESENWWIFITKKTDPSQQFEIGTDSTPIYYRNKPIVIDGVELIDGHFCWTI